MSENIQRETATIIRFPLERRHAIANVQPAARKSVERTPVAIVDSGSWYHDAAIKDAGNSGHH